MKHAPPRKPSPTIRPAAAADAEAVARLYIDSWNAGFGELLEQSDRIVTSELVERWRGDLAKSAPKQWWVAEHRGEIVGFAGIGPSRDPVDARLGELDTIAVDPSYWRMGIGKALASHAFRHLVEDGYDEAIVWTVEGYERGTAFYEAMGWKRDGGVRDNGRQVRLRRPLSIYRLPLSITSTRPVLLVDVDGVLNPFGFDGPPKGFGAHNFFPEDDYPVYLTEVHGRWLRELSDSFEMVWATGWCEDANRLLAPFFGLPQWPTIPFPPVPFDPAEKVPAIDFFARERSCAWIDDNMTPEALDWAAGRSAPALTIEVESSVGLTREMVDQLLEWANSLPEGESRSCAT